MQNTNNYPSQVKVLSRVCLLQLRTSNVGESALPQLLPLGCVYCRY
jgi:hypothetical protein